MATLTFDTLSAARCLREKGSPQDPAEAIADELRAAQNIEIDHLSTKAEVAQFKLELKTDMQLLEQRIVIKLGAMIMVLGGILIAIKFFG